MEFLIDAQLPPSLCSALNKEGYSCVHTMDLPQKNLTSDQWINTYSIKEKKVVITKDMDFYHSFMVKREPYKVLIIRTGNIKTRELTQLIVRNLDSIIKALTIGDFVELTRVRVKVMY